MFQTSLFNYYLIITFPQINLSLCYGILHITVMLLLLATKKQFLNPNQMTVPKSNSFVTYLDKSDLYCWWLMSTAGIGHIRGINDLNSHLKVFLYLKLS